jgi:biopolymer transport protein ExbD
MSHSVISEGFVDTDEPVASINVTSLIDVMFCLLIMFMIAAPLMGPEGQGVVVPPGRGDTVPEEEFLFGVISIDAKGNAFLGALPLSRDVPKMQEELTHNTKLKDDGVVFLQADQTVPFDRVVDVLVALQAAEVHKIGFMVDPNPARLREAHGS